VATSSVVIHHLPSYLYFVLKPLALLSLADNPGVEIRLWKSTKLDGRATGGSMFVLAVESTDTQVGGCLATKGSGSCFASSPAIMDELIM